jgi:hypothetical protein
VVLNSLRVSGIVGPLVTIAALSTSCGQSHHGDQRADSTHVQLRMVCESLRLFRDDRGRLPPSDFGLRALVGDGFLDESFLVDSWQREIRYEVTVPERSVRLSLSGEEAPEISAECDVVQQR